MLLIEKFVNRTEFSSYDDFFNNFKLNVPANFNFTYDVMDVLAAETPDALAMLWIDDRGGRRDFTFAQMKENVDKTASFFKSLGIGKGDMVMLILQRRYEWWFSMLALHKIGAVCIPATHMLTAEDIIFRNNAAKIKMIVAVDENDIPKHVEEAMVQSPTVKNLVIVNTEREGWISFDKGVAEASPFDGPRVTENSDVSLIYFTSGTTSHPKMVAHDYLYPLGHITTAYFWQKVRKGGLHLTVADTGWGKAVWGKMYGQWISQATVFVYDYHAKFKAIDLIGLIEKYHITTFCAPPTIYRFLIQEDLSGYDLSSLVHCSTAGEPLSENVFNKWKAITGLGITEGFGQTETTLSFLNFDSNSIKPGSIGKPSPYYNAVVLNSENQECDDGEVGEIAFPLKNGRFPGLFKEYLYDKAKTDSVVRDGYYFTGDTAWRDEDGFFWFMGRNDDVIKCSGYRIGTFEVESVLMQHPAVVECAVTGAPDPIRGQIVKATIVLAAAYRPGSEELVKEIQAFVKKTTAPYKYPRIVEFVDELPKTISGKIMRKNIREKDNKK